MEMLNGMRARGRCQVSVNVGVGCFLSSRGRHTRCYRDWSSDVCSSDLNRHAFERALLDADEHQPQTATSTRLWLDSPYLHAQAPLVAPHPPGHPPKPGL